MDTNAPAMQERIVRLLIRAVAESGRPNAEVARRAGIKRDSLRRTLAGERQATLIEAMSILEAVGHCGRHTLLLAILADEDFALSTSGSGLALFLAEFFECAPFEIRSQLGPDVCELRPRWAKGTARLLAKTLTKHVGELTRRGDAIGELGGARTGAGT